MVILLRKPKRRFLGSKMKIFENQLFTKVVFCLKILYKVGICGGTVRRSGKINRRFSLMKRRVVSAKGRFVLQKIGRLNNPDLLFVHLQAVFVKGKEDVSSRKDFFLFLHGEKDYQRGLEREYVAV